MEALLDSNAAVHGDFVPRIVEAAPEAVLLAVTGPPQRTARSYSRSPRQ